jgi:hypothetical protein
MLFTGFFRFLDNWIMSANIEQPCVLDLDQMAVASVKSYGDFPSRNEQAGEIADCT